MPGQVETSDGMAQIRLQGRFDLAAYRVFRDSHNKAVSELEATGIRIDFGSVNYLDSSVLRTLLMLKDKAQSANKSIILANCQGYVGELSIFPNSPGSSPFSERCIASEPSQFLALLRKPGIPDRRNLATESCKVKGWNP
jgi:anti-anti-sigma factor